MSAHPGGLEVLFWFDTTDNLWHSRLATEEFTDATLEGALKKAQAYGEVAEGALNIDFCFAVAIGDKS